MSAKTVVQVVTTASRPEDFLTMADLRVFIECWEGLAEFAEHTGEPADVEPVVVIEGQGGRIAKISADLAHPA